MSPSSRSSSIDESGFPASSRPCINLLRIHDVAKKNARWLAVRIFARPDVDPHQKGRVVGVGDEGGCKTPRHVHVVDWPKVRPAWSERGASQRRRVFPHPYRRGKTPAPSAVAAVRNAPVPSANAWAETRARARAARRRRRRHESRRKPTNYYWSESKGQCWMENAYEHALTDGAGAGSREFLIPSAVGRYGKCGWAALAGK
jgi:hypothetical protein